MLLVNSEKGRKLFERAKENMIVHEKEFDSILAGNPMFNISVVVPKRSYDFLRDLDNMSFSECLRKYTGDFLWKKIARKVVQALRMLSSKR